MNFVNVKNLDSNLDLIELNHPEKNLLNPEVMQQLLQAIKQANESQSTGIILTGAGEFFCGGLDVDAIQAGGDPIEFARNLIDILKIFPTLQKPIVAALNGNAVASGASIAAACDYVVCITEVVIGTYEVSVGIWPMIAQVPIIKRIGAKAAMENVGSGEPFSSQRAYEVGLVQKIVPRNQLLLAAEDWLIKCSRGAGAVANGRISFYQLDEIPYNLALDRSFEIFVSMFKN